MGDDLLQPGRREVTVPGPQHDETEPFRTVTAHELADQDRIEEIIGRARESLVATDSENPLVSFRYPEENLSVQIVDDRADSIYQMVTNRDVSLRFLESPSGQEEFDPYLLPQPERVETEHDPREEVVVTPSSMSTDSTASV